jgi:hypothetical protein
MQGITKRPEWVRRAPVEEIDELAMQVDHPIYTQGCPPNSLYVRHGCDVHTFLCHSCIQGIKQGPESVRRALMDDIDETVTYRSNQVLRNHKGKVLRGCGPSQQLHSWGEGGEDLLGMGERIYGGRGRGRYSFAQLMPFAAKQHCRW